MTIAYCWASGVIEFGDTLPDGAIAIARGTERHVRHEMEVTARHGYQPGVLLVPGIPEAANQRHAGDALKLYLLWLKQRERAGFRVAIKPSNPFDQDMCGMSVSELTAAGRVQMVARFDKAACMSALLVKGLQSTVKTAIGRRLRKLATTGETP